MEVFTVADLLVIGVALDLVGGYLLSLGLLDSSPRMVLRSGSFWGGNPHAAAELAKDRV
jgi:hypothetical protein